VNENVLHALGFAQGPVFRAAFALLVFGVLRSAVLAMSDAVAAYLVLENKRVFWRKLWMRVVWAVFPSVVLRQARPTLSRAGRLYHTALCWLSLVFRVGAILVPTFMVAHVYLWERALGVQWPALPGKLADTLAVITIVAGLTLFFGQLYSPVLRRLQRPWTFFKPLILILPFLTGYLAMHPRSSPLDWHFVMLVHVLSACLAFVMIPFGRLLAFVHPRLADAFPEMAWVQPSDAEVTARDSASEPTVSA
jgi:hypothetical protein